MPGPGPRLPHGLPDRVEREELLRGAVLAGDERAWQTWYNETFDDLYRYVRWRCGGRPDWADEIVQETWLTAVRRVRRFDPRQGGFLAWLRGIAANLLRNHLRRAAEIAEVPAAGRRSDGRRRPGRIASGAETWQRRSNESPPRLDALSEREEAVLRAKYLDGLSVAQIASDRGETPKAIESLLSRARQAFRDVYREQGDEEHAEPDNIIATIRWMRRSAPSTANRPATPCVRPCSHKPSAPSAIAAGRSGAPWPPASWAAIWPGITTMGIWRPSAKEGPQMAKQPVPTAQPQRSAP